MIKKPSSANTKKKETRDIPPGVITLILVLACLIVVSIDSSLKPEIINLAFACAGGYYGLSRTPFTETNRDNLSSRNNNHDSLE